MSDARGRASYSIFPMDGGRAMDVATPSRSLAQLGRGIYVVKVEMDED